ncbi:MAG: hypothetical protein QM811_28120 [Pirellulales bacterium]
MSRRDGNVVATVYLYRPTTADDDWTNGALREAASTIPGVTVSVDAGGALAEHFGSHTSGDVLVYDTSGHLRFHGGITSGRGHEGDNRGETAVASVLCGDSNGIPDSPVFGCALRGDQ